MEEKNAGGCCACEGCSGWVGIMRLLNEVGELNGNVEGVGASGVVGSNVIL